MNLCFYNPRYVVYHINVFITGKMLSSQTVHLLVGKMDKQVFTLSGYVNHDQCRHPNFFIAILQILIYRYTCNLALSKEFTRGASLQNLRALLQRVSPHWFPVDGWNISAESGHFCRFMQQLKESYMSTLFCLYEYD